MHPKDDDLHSTIANAEAQAAEVHISLKNTTGF
jgi:hypothetical protein